MYVNDELKKCPTAYLGTGSGLVDISTLFSGTGSGLIKDAFYSVFWLHKVGEYIPSITSYGGTIISADTNAILIESTSINGGDFQIELNVVAPFTQYEYIHMERMGNVIDSGSSAFAISPTTSSTDIVGANHTDYNNTYYQTYLFNISNVDQDGEPNIFLNEADQENRYTYMRNIFMFNVGQWLHRYSVEAGSWTAIEITDGLAYDTTSIYGKRNSSTDRWVVEYAGSIPKKHNRCSLEISMTNYGGRYLNVYVYNNDTGEYSDTKTVFCNAIGSFTCTTLDLTNVTVKDASSIRIEIEGTPADAAIIAIRNIMLYSV